MDHSRRSEIVSFLKGLRDTIVTQFENLEPKSRFVRKNWNHHSGSGGEISLIRGDIFEKAAVNWSGVSGEKFPTQEAIGPFFATGISLITHMVNPFAPTVHMNIRYIETPEKSWFGGGYDLTPMGFPFAEDTSHFHNVAKKTLIPFGEELYTQFSKNACEYFYIPHWKKERGAGGIFFDHFNSGDFERDLKMWKAIGSGFIEAILPIYNSRISHSYTTDDKEVQARMRAHYVEFNLLYDRGTRFGFLSGSNPEAILCSMPPIAKW